MDWQTKENLQIDKYKKLKKPIYLIENKEKAHYDIINAIHWHRTDGPFIIEDEGSQIPTRLIKIRYANGKELTQDVIDENCRKYLNEAVIIGDLRQFGVFFANFNYEKASKLKREAFEKSLNGLVKLITNR